MMPIRNIRRRLGAFTLLFVCYASVLGAVLAIRATAATGVGSTHACKATHVGGKSGLDVIESQEN